MMKCEIPLAQTYLESLRCLIALATSQAETGTLIVKSEVIERE
jgi:hypothetical protein